MELQREIPRVSREVRARYEAYGHRHTSFTTPAPSFSALCGDFSLPSPLSWPFNFRYPSSRPLAAQERQRRACQCHLQADQRASLLGVRDFLWRRLPPDFIFIALLFFTEVLALFLCVCYPRLTVSIPFGTALSCGTTTKLATTSRCFITSSRRRRRAPRAFQR